MATLRRRQRGRLTGILSGWLGARAFEARPRMLTARERRIAVGKDVLTGVIAATGIASAALGKVNYRRPPLKRVFRRTY